MKQRYVNELALGSKVDDQFVMTAKELRRSKNGDAYLAMTLSDRTGAISAYRFRPTKLEMDIPVGATVSAIGHVGSFKNDKRVIVDTLAPSVIGKAADFIPSATRPQAELLAELHDLVASVKDRRCGKLLRKVFSDKVLLEHFKLSPASESVSYAHIGGLLEHTVSVASQCAAWAERHPEMNRDLLVSAAILHDIGVVHAIEYDTSIRLTERGRLLGHEVLGARIVEDAASKIGLGYDDGVFLHLIHAVLSHHRCAEATDEPVTLEALALARVDKADTELAALVSARSTAMRSGEREQISLRA